MIHEQLTFLTYIFKILAYVDVAIVIDGGKSYRKQSGWSHCQAILPLASRTSTDTFNLTIWSAVSLLSLSFTTATRRKGQLFEVDLICIIPRVLFIFIISKKQVTEERQHGGMGQKNQSEGREQEDWGANIGILGSSSIITWESYLWTKATSLLWPPPKPCRKESDCCVFIWGAAGVGILSLGKWAPSWQLWEYMLVPPGLSENYASND